MNLEAISKYMSLLLRHKPEKGNLTLDTQGYTSVDKLLKVLNIDLKTLNEIVDTDSKKRYSFNADKTMIRANQGHSVPYVHIDFEEFIPTDKLYHGTAKKYESSILKEGLVPKSRLYVHLSKDLDTAVKVGMRHAKDKKNLVIFDVDAVQMYKDNYKFYISENNVVLIDKVPANYLKKEG